MRIPKKNVPGILLSTVALISTDRQTFSEIIVYFYLPKRIVHSLIVTPGKQLTARMKSNGVKGTEKNVDQEKKLTNLIGLRLLFYINCAKYWTLFTHSWPEIMHFFSLHLSEMSQKLSDDKFDRSCLPFGFYHIYFYMCCAQSAHRLT